MAEENKRKRKAKRPRQEWNPHWTLKTAASVLDLLFTTAKIAVGAALTVGLIVVICCIVVVGTLGDYLQNDILTQASNWSIDDYDIEETSFLYYVDNDGNIQQLQQIYTTTDRQVATMQEIPQALIDATVAIEDKRFYEHQGVDWITTVKACANMFFGGDSQFGGSTITQQLVKNVSEENSITVQRKVMEIFRAQLFEREYDKNIIMLEYLNRIYLGKGCYGVKSAAAAYFGKELQTLTSAECASLISITNNPSLFNPYSTRVYKYKGEERDGAGRNRYRQLNVLSEMLKQGYLTQEEYDEAVSQEMVFKDGIDDADRWAKCPNTGCNYEGTVSTFVEDGERHFCPKCGSQTIVKQDASQHIYSWFVDAAIIDVASDLAKLDGVDYDAADEKVKNYYLERIQKGGYHIYTTLDMDVQEKVDNVYGDLSRIPTTRSTQQLQSGIVVIDNSTGDIVALSGGVGEKTSFLAYNKATQAKLQTGSAQKPLSVYAPGFEKGDINPATVIPDLPISYENGVGYPKNDNREYQYSRTIAAGIVNSVNTISVRTLGLIGAEYGYSFAKYNFGQDYLTESYPLPNGQSLSDIGTSPLAMGALTVGATVRQMSAAYATFANNGIYREARTYSKVYNSRGELVLDNTQDSRKILSEKAVTYMNYCLYSAANYGTGGAALFAGQRIAGKTGTTSSNRDRWFCGYTKYYTAAVWCGYDQPEQIHLTGSNANPAARLWKMVMEPVHSGLPAAALYNGNNLTTVSICLDSGKLATPACQADCRAVSRIAVVDVYPEDKPTQSCDRHTFVTYCTTGHGVASEYCGLFPDAKIETRSLLSMTPRQVEELQKAMICGLKPEYCDDGAIYYVSDDRMELNWHGFSGKANAGVNAPYLICPLHNAKTAPTVEETAPTETTSPGITFVPETTVPTDSW